MKMEVNRSWVLAILMTVVMVFAMIPQAAAPAYADQSGQDDPSHGDKIWFGGKIWRVLENPGVANDDTNTPGILLLSEYVLEERIWNDGAFDTNKPARECWDESTIRAYLQTEFEDSIYMSSTEKGAVLTAKKNDSEEIGGLDVPEANSGLSGDRFFLLNYYQAKANTQMFANNDDRIAYNENGEKKHWFTRTAGSRPGWEGMPERVSVAFGISLIGQGSWTPLSYYQSMGVRPAFYLEPGSVSEYNQDSDGIYVITFKDGTKSTRAMPLPTPSAENGSITVSPNRAVYGQEVTLTLEPDADYRVGTVSVLDDAGNNVNVVWLSDTQCKFSMTQNGIRSISGSFIPKISIQDAEVVLSDTNFTYSGDVQKPAIEKIGEELLTEGTDYTAEWSDDSSKDAGSYTVTLTGKGNYVGTTQAEYTIDKAVQTITAPAVSYIKTFGNKPFSLNAVTNGDGVLSYSSDKRDCATVDSSGKVTIKGAGTAKITVSAAEGKNYKKSGNVTIEIKVKKATNPLNIKPKAAGVKYSKLKKRAQTLKVSQVIRFVKKVSDKKTYKLFSAKKGKKSFSKYFKINWTTGKITVKKGLKKGIYKVKVGVKAKGNTNYRASDWKKVIFKIKVQ